VGAEQIRSHPHTAAITTIRSGEEARHIWESPQISGKSTRTREFRHGGNGVPISQGHDQHRIRQMMNRHHESSGFESMSKTDDHSWDLNDGADGYLPESDEAFDNKFEEWEARDWPDWLARNLTFPFTITRVEDNDDAYFAPGAAKAPFRLGH
jgi:hypothetical protein